MSAVKRDSNWYRKKAILAIKKYRASKDPELGAITDKEIARRHGLPRKLIEDMRRAMGRRSTRTAVSEKLDKVISFHSDGLVNVLECTYSTFIEKTGMDISKRYFNHARARLRRHALAKKHSDVSDMMRKAGWM